MTPKTKLNRSCLLLAACLTLTVFASTVPAEARSTTGWNSYKIWQGYYTDASCLYESFGAVVSNCTSSVNLSFEMVVDNGGWHTITATGANSGAPYWCVAYSFLGQHGTTGTGGWVTPGAQTTFYVNVSAGGGMSLYCYGVVSQDGLASLNWNP